MSSSCSMNLFLFTCNREVAWLTNGCQTPARGCLASHWKVLIFCLGISGRVEDRSPEAVAEVERTCVI